MVRDPVSASLGGSGKKDLSDCNFFLNFDVINDHQSFNCLESNLGIHERKEREKEQRREDILDAAQRVFFEKGLAPATMDDIAETAELSKGTLYLYYKSKEDLYLTVMMRGMQLLYDAFNEVANSSYSPANMLGRLSEAYVSYFNDHRDYFRMMHFLQNPQFHKQVSDDVKQSCSILNQRIWSLVNGILQRCIDEGVMRKDLNGSKLSIAFMRRRNHSTLRENSTSSRTYPANRVPSKRRVQSHSTPLSRRPAVSSPPGPQTSCSPLSPKSTKAVNISTT